MIRPRFVVHAVVALAAGLGLVACGSSGHPHSSSSHTTASVQDAAALQFANCMRTHGVPNYPDPGAGGVVDISPSSGLNPNSPAFEAAQKACGAGPGGGGPGPIHLSSSEERQALRFAKCMRAHGVPNFPDPITTQPSADQRVLALRGLFYVPPPNLSPQSPAFQVAARKCGVPLPPIGAGRVKTL